MHAAPPRTPTRGNWIWLGGALVAVAGALTAFLVVPAGHGCAPLPGRPASHGRAAMARTRRTPQLDSSLVTGRAAAGGPAGPASAGLASPAGQAGTAPGPAGAVPPAAVTTPVPAGAVHGSALFYYPGRRVGSCTLGPLRSGGSYVSLPARRFHDGAACGSYLDVAGPRGTVQAEVVDLCSACTATTVDLSRAAFRHIAATRPGSARVSFWPAADPPLAGPLALRVSLTVTGDRELQVINNGNRLRSVAVRPGTPGATWRTLAPDWNGYWVGSQHLGAGPFTVMITDVLGNTATLSGVKLAPQTLVKSTVWMYHRPHPHHAPRVTTRSHPTSPAPGC